MSTGIGFGIAIPHASSDKVEDVVAAFGRSTKGIEFDSLDGQPVFFVVLFVVPMTNSRLISRRSRPLPNFLMTSLSAMKLSKAQDAAQISRFREPFATQLMATPREILTQRLKFALEKSFPDTAPEVVPDRSALWRLPDQCGHGARQEEPRSPREIARQIVSDLDVRDISEAPEIEGAGFINFR